MDEFESALRAVLKRHIKGFQRLVAADRLTGGASQETWRLKVDTDTGERSLCLRRNAGAVGAGSIAPRTEALLIKAAHTAGVPEPEIHHILEPADGLGEGFLMQWLEGDALGGRITHGSRFASVRPRLARQCGEILARLHSIEIDDSIPGDLTSATPEQLVRETWQQYRDLESPQPVLDFTARWLLENLPPPTAPSLVHGDFRNGNLMVSPEAGVIGVLDWELAGIGDPVRDLGWICTNSWRFGRADLPVGGFGTVEDLLEGYSAVSGVAVDRDHLNFWIVFGSFWWSVCCLLMAHSYRSGENSSVERPAIGRRASEGQADCVAMLVGQPVLPGVEQVQTVELPTLSELIGSVGRFLESEVSGELSGAKAYLSRVAVNSLAIAVRQVTMSRELEARELDRLSALLGAPGDLSAQREALALALCEGMALDTPGLVEHLRLTVGGQLAIDQPGYAMAPGLPG